jgi:hypothetical protein
MTDERALLDAQAEDGCVYPGYDGYCLSNVPGAAAAAVTDGNTGPLPADAVDVPLDGVEHVVMLVVDAFGWDRWTALADRLPFFRAVADAGSVVPLTAICPSATAAAVTTLQTGTTTAEHGMIGWNVYLDEYDATVQPLPYRTPDGDPPPDDLDLADAFDVDPVYPRLADAGVESFALQYRELAGTPYSDLVFAGAEQVGCVSAADVALELRQTLEAAAGPSYHYAYLPEADTAAHVAGTGSGTYRVQLEMFSDCFERAFRRLDDDTAAETLVLVVADHGQLNAGPDALDLLEPDAVRDALARHRDGSPVLPVGSPRNAHLHLRDGEAGRVRRLLDDRLDALVLTRVEVLERGLFGPEASAAFRRRVGDVVVIHRDRPVWHESEDKVGLHGGLSPAEMLVPLGAVRASELF